MTSVHAPPAAITLRLHAYPELHVDGRPVALALKHGWALLARLVDSGDRLSRAAAAELLWPDAPSDVARTRLRRLVHELHRRAGVTLVAGDADTLQLAAPLACDWIDTRRAARSALHGERPAPRDVAPLFAPVAGQLLDGFSLAGDAFDDWLATRRREHVALVAKALQRLAARWLDAGALDAAGAAAERLIALDRCAEAGYATLIAMHAARGDAVAVEATYFAGAEALRDELGVKPSPLLENAYADALANRAPSAEHEFAALLARVMTVAPSRRTAHGRPPSTMPHRAATPDLL